MNRIKYLIISFLLMGSVCHAQAQLTKALYFKNVPAGDYSGLAHISDSLYAVVDDKNPRDGYTLLYIGVSPKSGEVVSVDTAGFFASGLPNRDEEGVCYVPSTNTLYISAENDNRVLEYRRDGSLTGRELQVPSDLKRAKSNYGLEALTYDSISHRFYTVTEAPLQGDSLQYIMVFDDSLQLIGRIPYLMDKPKAKPGRKANYLHGIPEMLALPDGRLLVMEREGFFPKKKIGSWVVCKIFFISPNEYLTRKSDYQSSPVAEKSLITSWRTRMNILHQDLANYEGMTLADPLPDGRQVVIICADSQNQLGGLLRDWFRTLILDAK